MDTGKKPQIVWCFKAIKKKEPSSSRNNKLFVVVIES